MEPHRVDEFMRAARGHRNPQKHAEAAHEAAWQGKARLFFKPLDTHSTAARGEARLDVVEWLRQDG